MSSCDENTSTTSDGELALRLVAIVGLVGLSGMFSGLTLALLGLDTNQLKVSCFVHASAFCAPISV